MTAPNSRAVHAALANPQTRELWAQAVLGQLPQEPNARQRRGLAQLEEAGLVRTEGDDVVPTEVFRDLLAEGKEPAAEGWERFLEHGRVVRWPSRARDKHGLILWIMEQCLAPGEELGERELNERIRRLSDDPALVRRYCVDLGAVLRSDDGARYRRA